MSLDEGFLSTPDGVRLYYRLMGRGTPALVVPNGLYYADDFSDLWRDHPAVVYDPRNRGRSDAVDDPDVLRRGVLNDVDDLDAVRAHFDLATVDVLGHSYIGVVAALYAMAHAERVRRVVQIGPVQPDASRTYPKELAWTDATTTKVMSALAHLQQAPPPDPVARCRALWDVLRDLYVLEAADAHRIRWDRCELENERQGMAYWFSYVLPSIQRLSLSDADFARITAPTLVVHGTHDRSAPYGAGRDWASRLPNARLLTVVRAAHAPWIEAPDVVFPALHAFLGGAWPDTAKGVRA